MPCCGDDEDARRGKGQQRVTEPVLLGYDGNENYESVGGEGS